MENKNMALVTLGVALLTISVTTIYKLVKEKIDNDEQVKWEIETKEMFDKLRD